MASRLDKPWLDLTADNVARLGGQLGVFEVADASGETVLIGYAGGRSPFGLRGELARQLETRDAPGWRFRTEVNMAYLTRWRELLMAHVADHGRLPAGNAGDGEGLGRLSPA